MPTYTYAQLEQLWINNGGSAATAPTAAAIALAESSGISDNTNANDSNGRGGTQTSWGLWQISNGTHSAPAANVLDPNVNAKLAVAKYQAAGNSFQPWGSYTSGKYKADLSNGTTPDPNVPGAGTVTTAQLTAAQAAAAPAVCVIPYPTLNLVVTTVGGGCILTKSEARAMIGALAMAVAGVIGLAAAVILAASAFEHTGAARAVSQAVPPVRAVVGAAGRVGPRA